ncbi:ry [Bugula neritina]|uniref:Ry n=1 Tax=Bugula neritina TaxID=10212 RepID=A0A7J7K5L5_BUGNE|nr:ry [Bugula neritina]
MEHIISEISSKLNIEDTKIREMHLYQEGDCTHYKQPIINCNISKCWQQVLQQSDYETRKAEVIKYNSQNRYRKRGICAMPTKYGIAFGVTFLNQAAALVHIYKDGYVLLSHGDIPASKIHTMEVSTTTVANTSPTAASTGSDLNGAAVLNACEKLKERLKPFVDAKPDGKWEDWVNDAYFARVSLSATGYYATPDLYMDYSTSTGTPYAYFSFGAAVTEVEIDCLTGDHQLIRTDIVMDVGKSLNPAIDIGQIEGAFVQGYGWLCLEQVKMMASTGTMLTCGPGNYKIPGFSNIPQEFNVTLLKDVPNVKAVYSSKAVGEPPLFLSASAFFAIKSAVKAARAEAGEDLNFIFNAPCTPERIRMACVDKLSSEFASSYDPNIPPTSFFIQP